MDCSYFSICPHLPLSTIPAPIHADGLPAQTFCEAITKFTGVPEPDVLLINWRSEPFRPAHYLAIDRRAGRLVICIRGTIGHADLVTDFMCRPVPHEFSPSLRGHVHAGILQSAQYVIDSVWEKLQVALQRAPGLPILVTGVSTSPAGRGSYLQGRASSSQPGAGQGDDGCDPSYLLHLLGDPRRCRGNNHFHSTLLALPHAQGTPWAAALLLSWPCCSALPPSMQGTPWVAAPLLSWPCCSAMTRG